MFVEYGNILSKNMKGFFQGVQPHFSSLVHSPYFWPGVCVAALIGIWIYRKL